MHTVLWAQMIMCECLDYYVFYLEYVKSVCRQILLLLHSLHIGLSHTSGGVLEWTVEFTTVTHSRADW